MLKLIVFALLSVAADANLFVDIWRRLTHGTMHVANGKGGSFQYAGEMQHGSSPSPSASGGGGNEVVYGYYPILGNSPGSSSGNSPGGSSPGGSGNSVYGPFIATGTSSTSSTPSTNTDATPASSGNAEANELAALSQIQGPSANPNVYYDGAYKQEALRNGVPGSWSNQAKTAVDGSSICDDKASCKILAEDEAVSSWGCAYSECYRARGGNQWNCEPDPLKAKVLNRTKTNWKQQYGPTGCSGTCQSMNPSTGNYCSEYGTAVSSGATSAVSITLMASEIRVTPGEQVVYSSSSQGGYYGQYNNLYVLEVGDEFTLSGCETTAAFGTAFTVKAGTTDTEIIASVNNKDNMGADRTLTEICTLTVIAPRMRCHWRDLYEQVLESYSNGCKGPYVCKDDPTLWKSCTLPLQKNGAYDCKNHMDDNDDLVNGGHCNQMVCDEGFHSEGEISCTCGVSTIDTLACVPDTCDASTVPTNGKIGDCSSTLAHDSTCTPICDEGFHLTGTRSCHLGRLDDDVACGSTESRIVALETALATLQAAFAGIDNACLAAGSGGYGGAGRLLAEAPCKKSTGTPTTPSDGDEDDLMYDATLNSASQFGISTSFIATLFIVSIWNIFH